MNKEQEQSGKLRIIDFRCRPPFGAMTRDWIFSLEDKPGNPGLKTKYSRMNMDLPDSLLNLSMEDFFAECQAAAIAHTVVPLRKLPFQTNDDLVTLLERWPGRFSGFAGAQPSIDRVETVIDEIGKYIVDGPCAGLYLEPGLDPRPWLVDDESYFPIYEYCSKNRVPLCLLYGGVFHKKSPPPYSLYDPARIEIIAKNFPALRILLSHACWPFAAHACAVALNWENVWLSPDGFMIDHPGAQDYVIAANYRLQDKIVFGSLYPSMPMQTAVARYKELLRPDVWEKIFYKNGEKFLNCGKESLAGVVPAKAERKHYEIA